MARSLELSMNTSFDAIVEPIAVEMDAAAAVIEAQIAADQRGAAEVGRTVLGIVMSMDPDSGLTVQALTCNGNCTHTGGCASRCQKCPQCQS